MKTYVPADLPRLVQHLSGRYSCHNVLTYKHVDELVDMWINFQYHSSSYVWMRILNLTMCKYL